MAADKLSADSRSCGDIILLTAHSEDTYLSLAGKHEYQIIVPLRH
jgi:hypothetical protein